ncbi:MAG TPA: hypothetical protein VG692_01120, partial [Gemmatimonadales bacterium]|nr:hypothetical protein [Gemmatimonadales bacterium]
DVEDVGMVEEYRVEARPIESVEPGEGISHGGVDGFGNCLAFPIGKVAGRCSTAEGEANEERGVGECTHGRVPSVRGAALQDRQLTIPHKLRPEARSRQRTGRRLVVHAVHNPTAEDVSFMRWLAGA